MSFEQRDKKIYRFKEFLNVKRIINFTINDLRRLND